MTGAFSAEAEADIVDVTYSRRYVLVYVGNMYLTVFLTL